MFITLHTTEGDEIIVNMAKVLHLSRSDAGSKKYTLLLAEGGTSYAVAEEVEQILDLMRRQAGT